MKQKFDYGRFSYEYFIAFTERKTLALEVLPSLRIIVKAPLGSTLEEIEAFLVRKWSWLERQLADLRKFKKSNTERRYVSGESYYYLGRQYMLVVEKAKNDTVKLERGKLRIYTTGSVQNSEKNKKLLDEWYARNRERIFKQEYVKAFKLFDYKTMPQLGQRVMARRWGSYTSDGKVLLNPRLIEAPREAIYYVCIHELCHVVNKRHDEVFYKTMDKKLPFWRQIKESLEIRHG